MKPLPLLAAVLCISAPLGEISPAAENPNILLILVDDLKPALGCYGDPHAKTPNIDKLASRGMRFDLAYCNQAVCAPSRFTLMLGSHSTSTGLYGLGSRLRQAIPDAVTLPQHFAEHGGYRTESLGKIFHIGHGNQGDPESFSVPHFKEKVIEYRDPASKPDGKLTREEAMFQNKPAPPGGMNTLARGAAFESPEVADDAYADGRVAAETLRRLEAAKARRAKDGTPFFIAAGFARPHLPFSAPKKYWDLYDPAKLPLATNPELPKNSPRIAHKRGGEIRNYFQVPDKNDPAPINKTIARQLVHGYYASTSYVDAQIGRVIEGLDALGLAENTIIVLWGDHGFHLGDLGIWTKHTNYEQANRIPILISAPGVTKPNTATKQLAESVDIFPTLAELAGLPAPAGPQPIDGMSLVPVLKDPSARVRDHAFHAYPRRKLGRAIRTGRYRLVEWGDDQYELYDYQADPLESENLAAKKPEIVAELKTILARYPEPFGKKKQKQAEVETPQIANREIQMIASVEAENPHGVVLAQGGREHGYALHFLNGKPALDVRVDGKVRRLAGDASVSGAVLLRASIGPRKLTLEVNGEEIESPSPGLIPVQPKDGLSIGEDSLSAAGDYPDGNAFNGKVLAQRVTSAVPMPTAANPASLEKIETGPAAPNILLVMVDDLGPADLACYGSEELKTPRLDAFAKQGMKFNQAYAGCTVCAPTRSVLMTGIHMGRTSVRLNTGGVPILDSDVTIAEVLKNADYATGGFGKWGIGDINTEGAPERQGFDLFHGYYHQIHAHSYWPEYLIRNSKKEPNTPRTKRSADGYSHYKTVAETKAFIRKSAADEDRPFFCYAPWCPPHGGYELPAEDPANAFYKDKPWTTRTKKLAAMITMTDRHFGELLDLLDELGIADNTIVLFSSDNGGSEHKDVIAALNPGGELRGHKRTMTEGGIRTPFLVRWPGHTNPGSVTEQVISHQDVLPTLAEIAGVTTAVPEEVTGLSFVATLKGKSPAKTHDYHYWEWPRWDWGKQQIVPGGTMQALRQGDWKILRHRNDEAWELYYLPDDWGEANNLADKHPERVEKLAALVDHARIPMRPQSEPEMPQGKRFR